MEIRTARPTDQGDIAQLIHSAGPELYDFIYQTERHTALDYIRHEFQSGRGFCGHPNVTVAVIDGEVVATACFFDGKQYGKLTLGTVLNMIRFYGPIGVWPVLMRSKHVESVMKKPYADELYLSNFGVSPRLRGTGIGRAMMAHQIAEARRAGYRLFSLDVAATNPRAEKLYACMGLVCRKTKQFSGKRSGHAVPAGRKMELVL